MVKQGLKWLKEASVSEIQVNAFVPAGLVIWFILVLSVCAF
jgi:hypothetical protein